VHALASKPRQPKIAAFILAGGLSSRMGRDKARLQLGSRTMLGHVRKSVSAISLPVRVIRKDAVARCGPLGGIVTGFLRSRADAVLFLACDMPQIEPGFLRRLIRASGGGTKAVFAACGGTPGFPFILPRSAVEVIDSQRRSGKHSLRELAEALEARFAPISASEAFNVNAPDDLASLRRHPRQRSQSAD
jgi:molybdenum cofactor guanylyltransferase